MVVAIGSCLGLSSSVRGKGLPSRAFGVSVKNANCQVRANSGDENSSGGVRSFSESGFCFSDARVYHSAQS